jgi:hypothetical protein
MGVAVATAGNSATAGVNTRSATFETRMIFS